MKNDIIKIAAEVIIIIIAGYILPMLKAWLSARIGEMETEALWKLIVDLVSQAENDLKDDDPTGTKRYAWVKQMLTATGHDVTVAVEAMIERAVTELNLAQLEVLK